MSSTPRPRPLAGRATGRPAARTTPSRPRVRVAVLAALAAALAPAGIAVAQPSGRTVQPAASDTAVVGDTFENGSVGAWTAKASQKLSLSVVAGGASTTGHALQVTGVKKIKAGPTRPVDTSALANGQWYLLSGSVRTASGQAPATFTLTSQQSLPSLSTVPTRSSGGWSTAYAVFRWQGSSKSKKLTLTIKAAAPCSGDAVPTAYLLDDVTLTPVSAPPPLPTSPGCPTTSPTPTTSTPSPTPTSSSPRPCDLYATGGTPCVAAHSTTRALFAQYSGRLYQVRRASDGATKDITPVTAGGAADSSTQDAFCSGTACVISTIYDQSGRGNHLTHAPGGDFQGPDDNGYDYLAAATAAPTTVYGRKVYGVYVTPGIGYRNNRTSGIATGDQPEGMYAVLDGTHANGGCCFDYGNAETNSRNNGNGTMEAIYFGTSKGWGYGAGTGPWIMADFENGLFSGANTKQNTGDPTITHRYLTAMLKGGANVWALRGGNAASGSLSTFYSGPRPNASGYNPMKKEGAIILGIGGDNSVSARGTFYEGVMTSGYPSDATENAVQADIVAAGYSGGPSSTPVGIANRHSGLCADDYDWGTKPGSEVRQYTCNDNAVQDWDLRANADGYVQIVNRYSGLCLDDYNWHTEPGAEVRQWNCNGFGVQQWKVTDAGNGWSTLVNRNSGLCLDDYNSDTALGAEIRLWTCNGQDTQQWRLS